MQHLSRDSRRHQGISAKFRGCQGQVRFFALHRIEPHAPPLVRVPVNSFEFQPCGRTPQAEDLTTSSRHRLGRGLPGYLILFAPHAFALECQYWTRGPPSPLMFLPISTHFTATPGIPPSSSVLQPCSLECSSQVEPGDFTPDLHSHLRALYAQ
jgi:hypothetical protein